VVLMLALALIILLVFSLPLGAQELVDPRSGQLFLTAADEVTEASPINPEMQRPLRALPQIAAFMSNLGATPTAPKRIHFAPDPVNLSNGNLYLPLQDVYLPASRLPLKIERAYNSQSKEDGPFGFGWSFNYGVHIRLEAGGLVVHEGDGSTRRHESSEDAFEAEAGPYSRVLRSPDGGYERTVLGGARERFDRAGRLVRMDDGQGYAVQLIYQGERLDRVEDSGGRVLRFEYNRSGKIAAVGDPIGRRIRYDYSGRGDLVASWDADGQQTRYAYDEGHNLVAIRYPDGAETRMSYDSLRDLILSQEGPAGRLTTYEYAVSGLDRYSVTVTDSLGRRTSHHFAETGGELTAVTSVDPLGGKTTKIYDQRGNLVVARDPLGLETRYRYDRYNRVTRVIRPDGSSWTFEYHDTCGCGEPSVITNPMGESTRFVYDGNLNLTEIRNPSGQATRIAWDAKRRTRTILEPGEATSVLTYDATGLLVSAVDPGGGKTVFTHDRAGRLVALRDAKGAEHRLDYDRSDRVVAVTTPLGGRTGFTYDPRGRLLTIEDPDGGRTQYEYGALDEPTKVIDALGRQTSFEYDAEGNLTARVDPLGRRTFLRYDPGGRVVEIGEPGGRTGFSYDGAGRLTGIIDAAGTTTRIEFDALDRPLAVVDGLGGRTEYRYDALDRLVRASDAEGRETTLEYDSAGQLIKARNVLGASAQYAYDAAGHRVSRTDGKGAVTRYVYDRAGRLIGETDPIGRRTEYAYDARGVLTQVKYADGLSITLAYDSMGRLVDIRASSGEFERRDYTSAGRLRRIQTPAGSLRAEYDRLGQLVRVEETGLKKRIDYRYDEVGNRLGMTVSGFRDREYEFMYRYDAANRLIGLVNPFGEETRFGYDALGRRVREDLANGVSVEYAYDAIGRVMRKITTGKMGMPLLRLEYAYDRAGMIRETRNDNGSERYTYDAYLQLVDVAGKGYRGQFAYDPAGNLRSRATASGTVQLAFDAADQLASIDGATVSHDQRGNLTVKPGPQGPARLAYDGFNRLTGVTLPGGQRVSYRYGANGQLQSRQDSQGLRHFLYDGIRPLMELGEDLEPKAVYTSGPGLDEVISSRHGGQVFFYHSDPFWTVRGLSDRSGKLVMRYDYDSFGRLLTTPPAGAPTPLFTGRPYDAATGLVDYRLRQYDPVLGRFLQRDPLNFPWLPQHPYAYAANNPINFMDPYGLSIFDGIVQGLAGAAVGAVVAATVAATAPAWLAAGLAVGATATGGYLMGNRIYEAASGRAAGPMATQARLLSGDLNAGYTGPRLTQDQIDTRKGQLIVDVAIIGVRGSAWGRRGSEADPAWLNMKPGFGRGSRLGWDKGNIATSDARYGQVQGVPADQRGLSLRDFDPRTWLKPEWIGSGASSALRFGMPFAQAGSEIVGPHVPNPLPLVFGTSGDASLSLGDFVPDSIGNLFGWNKPPDPGPAAAARSPTGKDPAGVKEPDVEKRPEAELLAVTVAPGTAELDIGHSASFSAVAVYSDNSTRVVTGEAAWGPGSTFTAAAAGTFTVTATYRGRSGSATVTVREPAATGLAVSPEQSEIKAGATVAFSARASFADGSSRDVTAESAWSPATIFTGREPGTFTVSAAFKGVTGTARVTVMEPGVTGLVISPATKTIKLNESVGFKAVATLEDGSTRDVTGETAWEPGSSFTGTQEGAFQVAAAYKGQQASATVTVEAGKKTEEKPASPPGGKGGYDPTKDPGMPTGTSDQTARAGQEPGPADRGSPPGEGPPDKSGSTVTGQGPYADTPGKTGGEKPQPPSQGVGLWCYSEKTGQQYMIPYGPCPPPSMEPPVDSPTWQGQAGMLPPKDKKEPKTSGKPMGPKSTGTGASPPAVSKPAPKTSPPAGGGGCGPGTSCKCAGGTTGHISCDTGKCHCGGG
jgi:RHS repeat-associated protein